MKIISKSIHDTISIGKVIAKNLQKGDIICLFGKLGSGKTVLAKGIALGLGIKENKIISPSFVLIRQYNTGRIPLYHFDLYRLKEECDIMVLGYEEYLYDAGVSVIEWADRLEYLLPKERLSIKLYIKANAQRLLEINAFGEYYNQLLRKIRENIMYYYSSAVTPQNAQNAAKPLIAKMQNFLCGFCGVTPLKRKGFILRFCVCAFAGFCVFAVLIM